MERNQIMKCVLVALFAALIAAGAYIKIPLFPVPVVLSNLFVLLAASCLSPLLSFSSIIVYLLLGSIGLPIFTSGGGIAALLGPTGGYLFGMIPASIAGSFVMKAMEKRIRLASLLSALVSTVFIYLVGLPWLSVQAKLSMSTTIMSGLVPFVIGDTLKIIVTMIATPAIRPRVKELISN